MIRGRGAVAPGPTSAGDPYVPRRGSASFAVERYDLSLRYRVVANRLSGTATITATARAELDRCSLDLGGALRVARVKVDGKATRWVHRLGKLHVTL
ncbi:MAG: hypothetical protein Q8K72_04860, partial [Acidimicrobiales bacterium]|nr:hypothetical protein [Acidimicrobiales bacterium]